MPRTSRQIEAGTVYHVLNRGNGRRMLFSKEGDFLSFTKLIAETFSRFDVDLFAYCLMNNHWHLLVRPRTPQALSRCMAWLSVTHARRHHMHYPNPGSGHLYQGRFKSFAVQSDEHFLTVARYVHANPVRAKLVSRVEQWRWNDLSKAVKVCQWPVERPRRWIALVNEEMPQIQARQVEQSLKRGIPFGEGKWVEQTARRAGLSQKLKPLGRPRKPLAELSKRQARRRAKQQNGQKST